MGTQGDSVYHWQLLAAYAAPNLRVRTGNLCQEIAVAHHEKVLWFWQPVPEMVKVPPYALHGTVRDPLQPISQVRVQLLARMAPDPVLQFVITYPVELPRCTLVLAASS